MKSIRVIGCATLLALPGFAEAHSFGQIYNLPVPFWLYAWGASAALLLSFLAAAFFLAVPANVSAPRQTEVSHWLPVRWMLSAPTLTLLRWLALAALGLGIATGLFGTPNPYANFNMTLFWIVFLLGFAWLAALLGDWYALINPWRWLASLLGRAWPAYARGMFRYPARFGAWPALLLYMGFISVELFGDLGPRGLAWLLVGYSALNLVGAGLVGLRDWFTHCEFFSVWFRLVALMAPIDLRAPEDGLGRPSLYLRLPFAGLLTAQPRGFGELLFVLFMLSSTAYDGLHGTVVWQRLFWTDFYTLVKPWAGPNIFVAYPRLLPYFHGWQQAALLLSPWIYLVVYLAFARLSGWAAGSRLTTRELALHFAYPLLPIALVYHVSHYWTLILTQGVKIVALVSDPFGRGADYFGTAGWFQSTIIPDMSLVWHTQVGLIVAGHVASVVVAHLVALRSFGNARAATRSQLPMLVLMVAFTAAGLWILSQPLQAAVR